MRMNTSSQQATSSLLELAVPSLNSEQLALFQYKNLHVNDGGPFNVQRALDSLRRHVGQYVIGIDIGGDKAATQLFKVSSQGLIADDSFSDFRQDERGQGYIESLVRTATFAKTNNIPVGLSIGIPTKGTKTADKTKLPALQKDLEKYSDDFAVLIPTLTACLNDAPAGLISGGVHTNLFGSPEINQIIYVVNGGGIGSAVLKDGKIFALEAGHTIPVIDELNKYRDQRECGIFGATHLCLELAASNKQGIEVIWERKTGTHLSAIAIEKRFTQGAERGDLALALYDYSALMVAHLVKGLGNAFGITISDPSFAFIGHGGAFKFPDYGSRIKQILTKNMLGKEVNVLLTNSYSKNACLDGAALSALINS